MAAAYRHLCGVMLALIASGRFAEVLAASRQVSRLVKDIAKAEFGNHRRGLKLEMLSHGGWRERVLKDLGGLRKLGLWEAARERYETRKNAPAPESNPSVWRKTPERMAEEERQKAHARKCVKATAHPKIMRDPFRVDFERQFRLAPLPRLSRPRCDPATVPFDIYDYDYDGTPIAKMNGFDAPITVWPAEFRAAAELEAGIVEEIEKDTATLNIVIPVRCLTSKQHKPGPNCERRPILLDPLFRGDDKKKPSEPAREHPD